MKSKVLVSSILTIVLCFSLIVGSTFALFTSEDKFDIAITAGKVDLDASVDALKVYSAKGDAAGTLVDENGATYKHEEQENNTFANGGYATWDESVLSLVNITPGDKVEFNITGTNNSNVAVLYRYSVKVVEGDLLMSGLDITVNGTKYEALKSYTSAWASLSAGDITPVPVAIELPIDAGNEYQEESCKIAVTLEAVQGNAVVAGEETVEQYLHTEEELITAIKNGGEVVLGRNIALSAGLAIGNDVVLDLNGHTLSYVSSTGKTDAVITVSKDATLTINDSSDNQKGAITFESTTPSANNGYSTSTVINMGTLVVNGGKIINTTPKGPSYAIDSQTNGNINGDVEVTINGGYIESAKTAVRQCVNGTVCTNTLTINSGEIVAGAYGVQIHDLNGNVNDCGILTINDAKITGSYAVCINYGTNNAVINGGVFSGYIYSGLDIGFIYGGTFDSGYIYAAEGKTVVDNGDGTWTVQ